MASSEANHETDIVDIERIRTRLGEKVVYTVDIGDGQVHRVAASVGSLNIPEPEGWGARDVTDMSKPDR